MGWSRSFFCRVENITNWFSGACGSWLASECVGEFTNAFAGKPAPTGPTKSISYVLFHGSGFIGAPNRRDRRPLPQARPALKRCHHTHATRHRPAGLGAARFRRYRNQHRQHHEQQNEQRNAVGKKAFYFHCRLLLTCAAVVARHHDGPRVTQRSSTVTISRRTAMLAGTWSSSVKNCWYHSRNW